MATSSIQITFNNDLSLGEKVYFEKRFNDGTLSTDWHSVEETWVALRSNTNEVTIGSPTTTSGERSAINFVQSIGLDYLFSYSSSGALVNGVSRAGNVVTIRMDRFWNFRLIDPDPTSSDVSIVISNFESPFFTLDSVIFSQSSINPVCSHYKLTIVADENINEYSFNGSSVIDYDGNTLVLELLRGQELQFTLFNDEGQELNRNYSLSQVPAILSSATLYDLQINNSPSGATVIANILSIGINVFEYSLLSSGPWQSSNLFSGLPPEDYTVYIRDQYGCSINRSFTIDEFGNRMPYSRMPKSNPIRFKHNVEWSDCANYKTDENTLSCESQVIKPHKEIQRFQTCDNVPTQFRSSYSINTATVIKENGDEINVPVQKVSNYMGLKDSRDARKYDLGDGKIGIYFTNGNIYDFDIGAIIGEHTLNGSLPEWAVPGTYVKIDSEWYLIEDILFDETIRADILILSSDYTGGDVLVRVSSFYNRESFEEYEFYINMLPYLGQKIQVKVNKIDDSFEDVEYLSECISVKVRQVGTYEIIYKNTYNTDVNFHITNIEFKIRLWVENVSASTNDSSETHYTDVDAILLSSEIHEKDTFLFSPLTTEMMRKIIQVFAHSDVKINGISYTKDTVEVEGPLEDTNLYNVTATLIKGSNVFNSNSGDGSNSFAGDAIEIPGLVEYENGFVKY